MLTARSWSLSISSLLMTVMLKYQCFLGKTSEGGKTEYLPDVHGAKEVSFSIYLPKSHLN